MKKVKFFIFMLLVLFITNICSAEYIQRDDLYLNGCGSIQYYNVASVNEALPLLGTIVKEWHQKSDGAARFDESIAYCQYGYINIVGTGAEGSNAAYVNSGHGQIGKLLVAKFGISTKRGIKLGDDASLVIKQYGEPQFSGGIYPNKMTYFSNVSYWYRYTCKGGNPRLLIGVNNRNKVAALGFSLLPMGL